MGKIQQLGQRIVLRSPNIRDRTIKSSKENQNLKSSESKINHCRHASFEKNNIYVTQFYANVYRQKKIHF